MAHFHHRPTGRRFTATGSGFCSMLSEHPAVESGGVRQIRHTPRYRVALGLGAESYVNQRLGVAYASLSRRPRLHTVRCNWGILGAYRPRSALEPCNSATSAPSRKGGC
jgi:hypothetical protein